MSRDILPALRAVRDKAADICDEYESFWGDSCARHCAASLRDKISSYLHTTALLAIAERATSDPAPACPSCADLRSRLSIALDYERRLRAEKDPK